MKAVIPVAGLGSRLRPHTFSAPKAMVPVAGKPILSHILDDLVDLGVQELILIVGQMSDQIRSFVDSRYSFQTQYVIQEQTLGIAHALHQCRNLMAEQPILIVLGDTVYQSDFSVFRNELSKSAIGVKSLKGDLRRFGIVEVSEGQVTRLEEKPENPASDLVLAGVYYINDPNLLVDCVSQLILDRRTTHGEYQLTDALQIMVDRGHPMTVFTVDEWYDCGTVERLLSANRQLLTIHEGPILGERDFVIIPPVSIAKDASISSSVIGPHVTVAEGVTIERSVVSDSIICEQAVLQDCRLEESVVGANALVRGVAAKVNIGASSELTT
ncbi:MAG: NTP transferase domain-containing protein [Candidatus Latescibacteria bacterium]|jgi:glucose-1-phosphate thymidylyltransferase|nr:NTP transferase domain-containing protein [Candidatus Latescibacterota bacterium]